MSIEEILIAEYGKDKVSIEKAKKSKDGSVDIRIISRDRGSASISDKTHSKKPKSIKLIYLHTQNKSFLLFFYFFLVL